MATQVNPFHFGFDRGKRRTLAEIEAATKGFNTFRNQPARPLPAQNKVSAARLSEWVIDQGGRLGSGSAAFTDPNIPNSRRTPILILNDDEEPTSQQPRTRHAAASKSANTTRRAAPAPSSRRLSNRLKRKAAQRDDHEEDVIIVQPPPRTPTRGPWWAAEVIDLTKPDPEKRKTSTFGNRDDDVIIIEPPAAEIRRDLRALALGTSKALAGRPAKRQRRAEPRAEPRADLQAPDLELGLRRNPEPDVPQANAVETAPLLASVGSVTHFFTLAAEIRDKIYRHLLVSSKPIHVQSLWTELARRTARRGARNALDADVTIETQILRVCRRTALEGTRMLYSENTFLYGLRDPEILSLPNRRKSARKQRTIDLAKYGHLIRHMAIELEPNRTKVDYRKLMGAALDTIASPPTGTASPRIRPPSRPPCGPIHLHTLTITISPLYSTKRVPARPSTSGNQDVAARDDRPLSVIDYFSQGASVLKALQRINANFLRINVHFDPNARNRPYREGSGGMSSDEEEVDSDDDMTDGSTQLEKPKPRHLQTTLDLRFLPRHIETPEELVIDAWQNDMLIHEKRLQQGVEAEATLADLRQKIKDACIEPEAELRRGGLWEDQGVAEQRRRERRARDEAKFDGDAYDDENESATDDGRGTRGMKSLIISIKRVGDELRIWRP